MEITGVVKSVMPTQNGTSQSGKAWQKREFIIDENVGNYPNSLVITAFGDRVEKLNTLRVGDYVTARFDTQVREYNGRAFNNITLYDINQQQEENASMPMPNDVEYRKVEAQSAAVQELHRSFGAEVTGGGKVDDDLPF